jgi:MoaA/NifB/PqqE/SkfB family radical SAM enzyme
MLWRLSYGILARQTQVIPCCGGSAHSVVYASGDVAPCEMLPAVGSLSTRSFSDIRASDAWRKSRKSIRRKECWCTHNCALLDSIVFNPFAAFPHLISTGIGSGERL